MNELNDFRLTNQTKLFDLLEYEFENEVKKETNVKSLEDIAGHCRSIVKMIEERLKEL